jgi:hypothetical protein
MDCEPESSTGGRREESPSERRVSDVEDTPGVYSQRLEGQEEEGQEGKEKKQSP